MMMYSPFGRNPMKDEVVITPPPVAARLPKNPTMRDIHDYCVKNGLPSLAQGMIELPPPQRVRELASKYLLREDVHTYRNRWGEGEYREGIRSLVRHEHGIVVPVESILATQGVTSGIVSSLMYLKTFKNVTSCGLMVPFYTYHLKDVQTVFGNDGVRYLLTNDDFTFNFDTVEESMKTGLKSLIVTNPGNPTGLVLAKDDVEKLVNLAEKYGCYLIFDECYCDMVFTPKGFYSPIQGGLRDHVIVCRGFSKCLGIQSWRIGYLISDPDVVAKIMTVHDPVYICVPLLQHALGEYLLHHMEEYLEHSKKTAALIQRNWSVLSPAFAEAMGWIPIEPEGSMYGVFRHHHIDDMHETLRALQLNVGICPGTIFMPNGANSGFVRIHCGVSAEKADKIVQNLKAATAAAASKK